MEGKKGLLQKVGFEMNLERGQGSLEVKVRREHVLCVGDRCQ